jgi:hypothetical protein
MYAFKKKSRILTWRKMLLVIALTAVLQILGCKDPIAESKLPDSVVDEIIKTEFPRIGISAEELDHFVANKVNTPEWSDLIGRMTATVTTGEQQYGFGAFHFAMAYAVTGDVRFKTEAKEKIFRVINEPGYCDVTSSYLRAPDCTGQVALAADILFDELTDAEKITIFDYLEMNARNIVEINNWSGWGWQEGNPDLHYLNNYYPGHLQTILHYALLAYNHRYLARQYYQLVVEEELPAALELMSEELRGGHGAEGTWYDDKLFGHYAEVILMLREATNGRVDFGAQYPEVFADYVKFRLYAFNPVIQEAGTPRLYYLPTGDQPAVAEATLIDLGRLRLWLMMHVLKGTNQQSVAGYIKYFEQNVNFESKGWQREFKLYYLLHYDNSVPIADYTQELSNAYLSSGKGVAHYRTGWGSDDLTATIHFSPGQGQRNSHWAFGEGAFYIWNKGWQADNQNRLDGNGIRQNTGLMNTLLVNGDEESQGQGDSKVLFFKGDNDFMAVKGDITELYQNKLDKFERTFIVTDKVMTVYDCVIKKTASDAINFLVSSENGFHTKPNEPGKYTTENSGGRLTIKTLSTVNPTVSTSPMRISVDFNHPDLQQHIFHAMEAGDGGSSSANMNLIDNITPSDTFMGASYLQQSRAYVHVVNKTPALQGLVGYTSNFGAGPMEHVITGMSAGNYSVRQNGTVVANVLVGEDGVIHFTTTGGGEFDISK